jgi:uncharacterized protein DUF6603
MGGGRLDAVFNKGSFHASFSAYADFIIHFRPFQFQAEVGINVYVSATIGWEPFSTDVSLEIGASLSLHGPPLAGVAHLHLWFINVTVRFGPDRTLLLKLSMTDLLILVKQVKTLEEAKALPDHLFSITKGAITPEVKQKGSEAEKAIPKVRCAQLQFEVLSRVPIIFAECNKRPASLGEKRDVYSVPMQLAAPFIHSTIPKIYSISVTVTPPWVHGFFSITLFI